MAAASRNTTSQQHTEKFYKGSYSDTPWNKDLLWRYHVAKEDKQEKVNLGERLPNDATIKRRQERMIMGMTGTLIPDITPRQNNLQQSESRSLLSSPSSGKRLATATAHGSHSIGTRSITSRGARSMKTESICSRTSSSASLSSSSSSSSLHSMRLQDVQEILESQSRMLKQKTDEELSGMRHALQEEARKREEAEKKIHFLCEKLGIQE